MNKTIKKILVAEGFKLDDYIYIDKTCNNVKLLHKKSCKEVNIRW